MRSPSRLLAAFLLLLPGVSALAQQPAKGRAAGTDLYGDPLPPGAIARLGTLRYRLGADQVQSLRFSPDGQKLLSLDARDIARVWAASSGKEQYHFQLPPRQTWLVSPDCRLGITTGRGRSVQVWDCETHRLICEPPFVGSKDDKRAVALKGKALAVAVFDPHHPRCLLRVWGLPEGRLLHEQVIEEKMWKALQCSRLSFTTEEKWKSLLRLDKLDLSLQKEDELNLSPDGSLLVLARDRSGLQETLTLIDLASGKQRFQLGPIPGRFLGVRFSPDSRILLAAMEEVSGDRLYLWDVATGKPMPAPALANAYVDDVLLDGQTLVIHQRWKIFLYETATGKQRHRLEVPRTICDELKPVVLPPVSTLPEQSCLALSPDGKLLAAALDGYYREGIRVRLWETASGKEVRPVCSGHDRAVVSIAFAPDGKTLASVSNDETVKLWDAATSREMRTLPQLLPRDPAPPLVSEPGTPCAAFTPDGKTLVIHSLFKGARRWDVATGKAQGRLLAPAESPASSLVAPDGKKLLMASGSQVLLWDTRTDKVRGRLAAAGVTRKGAFEEDLGTYSVEHLALSPDGRLLAAAGVQTLFFVNLKGHQLELWERDTGQRRWLLPHALEWRIGRVPPWDQPSEDGNMGKALVAFAADGKTLVWNRAGLLEQVDVLQGKVVRQLPGLARDMAGIAASPVENLLAIAYHDGSVDLIDLTSGERRGQLRGHRSVLRCVAFSPDGRILATGGEDTTVLLWDVASALHRSSPPAALAPKELDALWQQLASSRGEVAAAALARLQEVPAQAIAYVRDHLAPVAAVDADGMNRLIDELDSSSFSTRQRAAARLQELAEQAEPYLRKLLSDKPPLEMERRLRALLDKGEGFLDHPDQCRALRAVELLERIGTADARAVLHRLAGGSEDALLTREARAALRRLGR
jgi:WD40 repeat protein